MLGILKGALATITKRWKAFVGILLATLVAVVLALLLRRFSFVRLPAALAATSVFLILLLWLFPKWQVRSVPSLEAKDRFDRENEARKTLSQILGGLVLLIGFYFTWQNLKATQESLNG